MIDFECSYCGAKMSAPLSRVGGAETCPQCYRSNIVPEPPRQPGGLIAWAKANPKAARVLIVGGICMALVCFVVLVSVSTGSEKDAVEAALLSHGWSPIGTPETRHRPKLGRYANQTTYQYKHKHKKGGIVYLVCCGEKVVRFQLNGGTRGIEWKPVLNTYRSGLFEAFQKHRRQNPSGKSWGGTWNVYKREVLSPTKLCGIASAIWWEEWSKAGDGPVAFLLRETDYWSTEARAFGYNRFAQRPPAPNSPHITKPRTWQTIKTWTGRGTKETESFLVASGEWRIKWEAPLGNNGGIFQVFVNPVEGIGGSVAANATGPCQGDTSYVHGKPWTRYYLMINSYGVPWKVTAEDQR